MATRENETVHNIHMIDVQAVLTLIDRRPYIDIRVLELTVGDEVFNYTTTDGDGWRSELVDKVADDHGLTIAEQVALYLADCELSEEGA